jgi:DNA-binding response OmpR family regulator
MCTICERCRIISAFWHTRAVPEILIVEDAAPIAELVADHLRDAGHQVSVATDGASAQEHLTRHLPALVVLDVMLPVRSGIEVCRWLRSRPGPQPVVIMLTARREEKDALSGYDAGADDYVRKPFSILELVRRIDALLLLSARQPPPQVVLCGALRIDVAARKASVERAELELAPLEFDLLLYLVRSAGQVLERDLLLREVWGYEHAGYARTVDSHVTRIRRKLALAGLRDVIRTVHGVGYCFEPAEQEST